MFKSIGNISDKLSNNNFSIFYYESKANFPRDKIIINNRIIEIYSGFKIKINKGDIYKIVSKDINSLRVFKIKNYFNVYNKSLFRKAEIENRLIKILVSHYIIEFIELILSYKIQESTNRRIFIKTYKYTILCTILIIFLAFTKFDINYNFAYILFGLNIIINLITLFFGHQVNGSKRWISFGSFNFEPGKFTIISNMLFALHYSKGVQEENFLSKIFFFVLLNISSIIELLKPDLANSLLILINNIFFFLYNKFYIYIIFYLFIFLIIIIIIIFYGLKPNQLERLQTFFKPNNTELNILLESSINYIFRMLNEQLGILGYVIFLIIYYKIYNIITFKKDRNFNVYIAFILFLQETIGALAYLGYLPINLIESQLSYGGTNKLISFFYIGLLFKQIK